MMGHPVSAETKRRISLALIGKPNLHKSHKLSAEAKAKISSANIGRPNSEEAKRKISIALTGRSISAETREKLSVAHKGKIGPSSSHWLGGITPINMVIRHCDDYVAWRTAVFQSDNYTCQECGQRGVPLEAHHIKSFAHYPELRFDVDNGITLCEKCHHKKGRHHRRFSDDAPSS
jgi:hypothetical protein